MRSQYGFAVQSTEETPKRVNRVVKAFIPTTQSRWNLTSYAAPYGL